MCELSSKCQVWICVCVCTYVCACLYMYSRCEPQQTRLPLCAEDGKRKVQPHAPVAPPTNLVVTVPFIPPIGHGALWQSHVFAHWERQFLANFNRTVAHKKGRATCTGGGANPAHLFYSPPRLSCLWMCCPWTGPCRIWWSCWMLNVPWAASCSECERKNIYIYFVFVLFLNRTRSFGCVLINAVWLKPSGKSPVVVFPSVYNH